MRLATQIFVSALSTALLCTLFGSWLLGQQAEHSAEALLDGQIRVGEQSLRRQWQVQREQRYAVFESVAKQTFLRAYLSAGDRDQMTYFVGLAKGKGADVVAISNQAGEVLASEGPEGKGIVQTLHRVDWPKFGDFLSLPRGATGWTKDTLLDVQRLPIGDPQTVGHLWVARRITAQMLRQEAEPVGVQAALAWGDVLVSTLSHRHDMTADDLRNMQSNAMHELRMQFRVRLVSWSAGLLLVAVPLAAVKAYAADLLRQIALVLLLLLAATILVSLVTLNSIARPLRELSEAAESLGAGDLQTCRARCAALQERGDEIGILARTLETGARRLADVMTVGQQLAENLNTAVAALDQSAMAVERGASRQEEQIHEIVTALSPIQEKLESAQRELSELSSNALFLSLSISSYEYSAPQKAGGLLSAVHSSPTAGTKPASARVTPQMIRSQFADLRLSLQRVRDIQVEGQKKSAVVGMVTNEIGHVAKQHANQAKSLLQAAERLRRDTGSLLDLLSRLQVRTRSSLTQSGVRMLSPESPGVSASGESSVEGRHA